MAGRWLPASVASLIVLGSAFYTVTAFADTSSSGNTSSTNTGTTSVSTTTSSNLSVTAATDALSNIWTDAGVQNSTVVTGTSTSNTVGNQGDCQQGSEDTGFSGILQGYAQSTSDDNQGNQDDISGDGSANQDWSILAQLGVNISSEDGNSNGVNQNQAEDNGDDQGNSDQSNLDVGLSTDNNSSDDTSSDVTSSTNDSSSADASSSNVAANTDLSSQTDSNWTSGNSDNEDQSNGDSASNSDN